MCVRLSILSRLPSPCVCLSHHTCPPVSLSLPSLLLPYEQNFQILFLLLLTLVCCRPFVSVLTESLCMKTLTKERESKRSEEIKCFELSDKRGREYKWRSVVSCAQTLNIPRQNVKTNSHKTIVHEL